MIAQRKFVPGHIYTVNKDTLAGWISLQDDTDLAKKCVFRPTQKDKPRTYGFSELSGFRFDNENRTFKKRTVEHLQINREVFLETIVSGNLELLCWNDILTGVVLYLSKKGNSTLIDMPFEQSERLFDDGYTRRKRIVSSTMHQDTLRKYMQDRTDLFGDIERISKPTRSNLTTLVLKYNNYDQASVEYAPKPVKKPISIYVTPSIVRSEFELQNATDLDFFGGATLGVGFHGEKDLVILSTGFYNRFLEGNPVYQNIHRTYLIPLNLEYRFTNYWFQPNLSFGVDAFINQHGLQFMFVPAAGVNIRIVDRLALTCKYAIDMRVFKQGVLEALESYAAISAGIQFRF